MAELHKIQVFFNNIHYVISSDIYIKSFSFFAFTLNLQETI